MSETQWKGAVSRMDGAIFSSQEGGHTSGSSVDYGVGTTWDVTHRGTKRIAKGVRLLASNSDQSPILMVHLVEDAEGTFYTLELTAGEKVGCLFDQISKTSTTVTLADVDILF